MGGGNAGTYSGVNYALADIIDSFSVYGTDLSATWTTSPSCPNAHDRHAIRRYRLRSAVNRRT
jgi:hypothetical protein